MTLNSRYSSDHTYYTSGSNSLILLQECLMYQFQSVMFFMERENEIVSHSTAKEKSASSHPLSDIPMKLRLYLFSP